MSQIAIISGTHRKNSKSFQLAMQYASILENKGVSSLVLDLSKLPANYLFAGTFGEYSSELDTIIESHISQCNKFVFIIPEYNGSFPGSLKAFIDCIEPKLFHDKKAGLIGLSAGRAGNLRGMEHFTGILHYLQVEVMSAKPKLSQFHTLTDDNDQLIDQATIDLLEKHAEKLLNF